MLGSEKFPSGTWFLLNIGIYLFYIFSHKSCFHVVFALKDRLLESNISSYMVKLLNYNNKTNPNASLSVSVIQITSEAFDSYKITGGYITTKFYRSLENS